MSAARSLRWPWWLGFALLSAALTLQLWQPDADPATLVGQPVPGFALPHAVTGQLDGPHLHRHRPLLVHFWSTTCPPCVAELPAWQQLAQTATATGVDVLTVTGDERAELLDFLGQRRLDLAVLLDATGRVHGAYGVRALPTTAVVAADGRVRAVIEGARPLAALVRLATGQSGN